MTPSTLCLVLALALSPALPALSQDHEDEHLYRRTRAEVRDFLKANLPDALHHLEHAEEEGHNAKTEAFWEDAASFVGEYHHTREELGEEAASTFLQLHQLQFTADRLTERFHQLDDPAARLEIKTELQAAIGKHLDLSLQLERIHLDQARKEIEEAARELDEAAGNRARIVNDELKQRLYSRAERISEHQRESGDDQPEREFTPEEGDEDHPEKTEAETEEPEPDQTDPRESETQKRLPPRDAPVPPEETPQSEPEP